MGHGVTHGSVVRHPWSKMKQNKKQEIKDDEISTVNRNTLQLCVMNN